MPQLGHYATVAEEGNVTAGRSAGDDFDGKTKILVIGAGTAGLTASRQIYNKFKDAGTPLATGDITILDAAEFHHYQPGWTLVGSGLKRKNSLRRRIESLIHPDLRLVTAPVKSFDPSANSVTTAAGQNIKYDILIVAAGLSVNFGSIPGLIPALADNTSGVSSIYSYDTCDKTWGDIEALRNGKAIFTQPAGVIKCAGAPQKIMFMAWDRFQRTKRGDNISVSFITGMPTMFSVPKYSVALNALRESRQIGGLFEHNLVSINPKERTATFKKSDGSSVEEGYSMLHVTPPMGPLRVIKESPLADSVGWVDVDQGSLQHKKAEFKNVFALGDCSSLPTSKTAAAITAQAPVLTENVYQFLNTGKVNPKAVYDGYTSCPLLTGYGQLMLAEFMYGLKPKETFSSFVDQTKPNRLFYNLKKDIFPSVYYSHMIEGKWFGPKGLSAPVYE